MFLNPFGAVILASTLACLITTIGIYVIQKNAKWGNQNIVYLTSFAAGVLISVSFIHIIPFNVSIFTGVLAAMGMALHEFPEGIVTFLLLEREGISRCCHDRSFERLSKMNLCRSNVRSMNFEE
jgi:zinc and cadmium transporter